ncbi:MAG TPA: SulP family inorganic anion transporter [Candidatus Nanopelagicales bacterium]|nr:SulP family inorganic anion transporter [Candidatus Nanopelagicales bacterium]
MVLKRYDRSWLGTDLVAGVTLAAVAIPEVMGYTSISQTPIVTGLYTVIFPTLLFALIGSSRLLVVGADSATAAILAAGLAGLGVAGLTPYSSEWVAWCSLTALVVGALLLLARVLKLGFIGDFLSSSVLIGFLTGVGVQVLSGQIPDLLGIPKGTGNWFEQQWSWISNLGQANPWTVAFGAATILIILGFKRFAPKIPGALVAVILLIALSSATNAASHGVAEVGSVQGGFPPIGLPQGVSFSDAVQVLPTAVSCLVLIIAQSAATARSFAMKHGDRVDINRDLVGLTAANAAAGLSGTFVVNGSPTKTEILNEQGGRSQVANMTMALVVLIVTLFFTAFLAPMPKAVLGGIVFLIGVGLVDIKGLKHVKKLAPTEFWIALLTAAVVCAVGVEQGIILALVVSVLLIIERSYRAHRFVVGVDAEGSPTYQAAEPGTQSLPGLIVFRYDAPLFYANANRFADDVEALIQAAPDPVTWVVLDCDALVDVDYSAGEALDNLVSYVHAQGAHFVLARPDSRMLATLGELEVTDHIGKQHVYDTLEDAIAAFRADPSGRPVTAITPATSLPSVTPPESPTG